MSVSTMSAYGRTWPMITVPMIWARISIDLSVDPDMPIEAQIQNLETELRAKLPEGARIDIQKMDCARLGDADSAEYERLTQEALERDA